MKSSIFLVCLSLILSGCGLHPPRVSNCCGYLNRPDTKFEKVEQGTGIVLIVAGFLTYVATFVTRGTIHQEDISLNNQILGSSLGAAAFGILISWDGMGAFQDIGKCRVKNPCEDHWWEDLPSNYWPKGTEKLNRGGIK